MCFPVSADFSFKVTECSYLSLQPFSDLKQRAAMADFLARLPLPPCALMEVAAALSVAELGRAREACGRPGAEAEGRGAAWARNAAAEVARLEEALAGAAAAPVLWPGLAEAGGLAAWAVATPRNLDLVAEAEDAWDIPPGCLVPDELLADHLAEQWGATSWKTALHICGAEDELGALGASFPYSAARLWLMFRFISNCLLPGPRFGRPDRKGNFRRRFAALFF